VAFFPSTHATYAQPAPLQVHQNNRLLATTDGKPVFLIGDTAWKLAMEVNREDVQHYLDVRQSQHFNTIGIAAIFGDDVKGDGIQNVYGDAPFEYSDGRPDPTKPLTTPGNDPNDANAYDYWDHLDFVLDEMAQRQMYPVLVINFNGWVVGSGNGGERERILFDEEKAYAYGRWIGDRYKNKKHLLWMMGGDRSAVYEPYDYRDVFNAMAEGVADGIKGKSAFDGKADYSNIMMSFHPQKRHPNSSAWFHQQPWLSFNSIQACPSEQVDLVSFDYRLYPQKPTWLFEGRYENYSFDYKAWPMRFQAWLSVMAGGFGHVYGHEKIWHFADGWKNWLYEPGMMDMQHLFQFFDKHLGDFTIADLVPNQQLLKNLEVGDVSDHCWSGSTRLAANSTRIQAMTSLNDKLAVVYASDGSDVEINRGSLKGEFQGAYWYNPQNGMWNVPKEARDQYEKLPFATQWPENSTFDPPGLPEADNDWVLLLEME
jgi:hypothetical protein